MDDIFSKAELYYLFSGSDKKNVTAETWAIIRVTGGPSE